MTQAAMDNETMVAVTPELIKTLDAILAAIAADDDCRGRGRFEALQILARHQSGRTGAGDHPDLAGHIADAVRDACNIVIGKVVSFDDSRGIANTILDRIRIANGEFAALSQSTAGEDGA